MHGLQNKKLTAVEIIKRFGMRGQVKKSTAVEFCVWHSPRFRKHTMFANAIFWKEQLVPRETGSTGGVVKTTQRA